VTGAAVSFAHTVLPTHWAPFVVAARARRWETPKLLVVALGGALAHTLSTALIGALALGAGLAAFARFGARFEQAAGGVILAIGAGLALQALRGGHGHAHGRARQGDMAGTDLAAALGLIGLMLVSPCEVALPVYLSTARYGWTGFCALTAGVAAGTAGGMLIAVLAARAGLQRFLTRRWAQYEGAALGLSVMLLGIFVVVAAR